MWDEWCDALEPAPVDPGPRLVARGDRMAEQFDFSRECEARMVDALGELGRVPPAVERTIDSPRGLVHQAENDLAVSEVQWEVAFSAQTVRREGELAHARELPEAVRAFGERDEDESLEGRAGLDPAVPVGGVTV